MQQHTNIFKYIKFKISMQKPEISKIKSIYDYVSAETQNLKFSNGAFVFGRADSLVAKRAADLYRSDLVDYILITGGIGKDSGPLPNLNPPLPEATYLGALLVFDHNISSNNIYLETRPTNGGECCRFGIEKIIEEKLPRINLTTVAHSTSLKRVTATLKLEAKKSNFNTNLQSARTAYNFNPSNPIDQKEAVAELIRLADWPAKGWCTPQEDLPLDLVDYAKSLTI
jgi:hypothetical protein